MCIVLVGSPRRALGPCWPVWREECNREGVVHSTPSTWARGGRPIELLGHSAIDTCDDRTHSRHGAKHVLFRAARGATALAASQYFG
eukprot:1718007-Prymnesium_polylepis.1